jgi:hypothetical protein
LAKDDTLVPMDGDLPLPNVDDDDEAGLFPNKMMKI